MSIFKHIFRDVFFHLFMARKYTPASLFLASTAFPLRFLCVRLLSWSCAIGKVIEMKSRTFIFDQVIVVEGGEPGQVGQAVAPVGGAVAAGIGTWLGVVLLRLVHKGSRSCF